MAKKDDDLGFVEDPHEDVGFLEEPSPDEEKGPGEKALSAAMDYIVEPAAAALDYTAAPIRQAAALPAKAYKGVNEGDTAAVLKAFSDPLTQLFKAPSSAPTSDQVAEMYGVPRENIVKDGGLYNPLYSMEKREFESPKELMQAMSEPVEVTYRPSMGAGVVMDTFMGGLGLKGLSRAAKSAAPGIGNKLKGMAENLALNSTGATGAQTAKFADDAGRQLLDRKLVRFGDNAENIASRTEAALEMANADIDDALRSLDAKGVTASADNVVAELQAKIASLRQDPSQASLVRKLESTVDDIINTGRSEVPISEAEATKRGFRKAAGNWMDPEAGQAGKQAYLSYMDEVESAAQQADPDLALKFIAGKETHGLLRPIQEAAERRVRVQNQSPLGGWGDITAAGSGGAIFGPVGAVAAAAGRRLVSPRIASSAAVAADKVSKPFLRAAESGAPPSSGQNFSKPMLRVASSRVNQSQASFPQTAMAAPLPMTEDDVQRMNLSNSEKAQKINMIRRGVQIYE